MHNTVAYQDSYSWGFGEKWLNRPTDYSSVKMKFSSPIGEVLSIREEIERIALLVKDEYHNERLMVGLSGGYDSQAICYSLKRVNASFEVAFKLNLYQNKIINQTEYDNVQKVCQKNNYRLNIIPVEIDQRMSFYKYLIKSYFNTAWGLITLIEIPFHFKDRVNILGSGESIHDYISPDYQLIKTHLKNNDLDAVNEVYQSYFERFVDEDAFNFYSQPDTVGMIRDMGIEAISSFFFYHPNYRYAYMDHPLSIQYRKCKKQILTSAKEMGLSISSLLSFFSLYYKPMIYQDMYKNDEILHFPKMHGLETYPGYNEVKNDLLKNSNDLVTKDTVLITGAQWEELRELDNVSRVFE